MGGLGTEVAAAVEIKDCDVGGRWGLAVGEGVLNEPVAGEVTARDGVIDVLAARPVARGGKDGVSVFLARTGGKTGDGWVEQLVGPAAR